MSSQPLSRPDYEHAYADALRELLSATSSCTEVVDGIAATLHRTEHATWSDIVFSVERLPGYRFGISDEIWTDDSPPDQAPDFAAELMCVSLGEQLDAGDQGLPADPRADRVNWLLWPGQSSGRPAPAR